MAMYAVIKLTTEQWQRIYRGGHVTITDLEAILSVEELRSLNLWEAAKEISEGEQAMRDDMTKRDLLKILKDVPDDMIIGCVYETNGAITIFPNRKMKIMAKVRAFLKEKRQVVGYD